MLDSHVIDDLAALLDGQLPPEAAQRVREHLDGCELCRAGLEDVGFGIVIVTGLPKVSAPPGIWRSIGAALDARDASAASLVPRWRLAWAAALILSVATGLWNLARLPRPQWEVTRIAGSAQLSSQPLDGTALAGAGSEIATGADGRARIRIGRIGMVEVDANTRVRLIALDSRNHRLALGSGSVAAIIAAPPRMFFIETPSGTAVDLGCEYKLECDRAGNGLLRVTAGWVAYQWRGRESLVPAGAACRTRAQIGPGTPFFEDAPVALVEALDWFDFGGGGLDAAAVVLREARVRDTLTLWHILARVDPGRRASVYERMAKLSPPPAGVSREQVLRLDPAALARWKEELAWTW
jgi:hypothetical protein